MDGSDLVGELVSVAAYDSEEEYVVLTPDETGVYGVVDYDCTLPSTFLMEFDFKSVWSSEQGADAIYFYFFSNKIPKFENGIVSVEFSEEEEPIVTDHIIGYVISFDEYENKIAFNYVPEDKEDFDVNDQEEEFVIENDTWYHAKVYFSSEEATAWVFIDDELIMKRTGLPIEFGEDQVKFGIGARTGGSTAEHRIRGISATVPEELPESPIPPDVENFMLFSWGRQVWSTWQPNEDFLTEVQYSTSSEEEWSDASENYVETGIGEI
jgi:hypothetical protein